MRRQNTSQPELPALPVRASMPALRTALAEGHAILSAEPGSGKTTLVPLLLCEEPWLRQRRILMLEPRRAAARMAARRMAVLLGEPVGATVGYQVRFERRLSVQTRIEVLTEGLLVRRLQSDPELQGVGLLIFDEFHERNLYGDLSLALSLDVCAGLRDDLRLLAMSASLDTASLAELMGAQVISAAGLSHPVAIEQAAQDLELRRPVPDCLRALPRALDESAGDVLVFLPGRREIEQMRDEVQAGYPQVDAVALYGDLPGSEQDRILLGGGSRRRVILATDLAETSLTIAGVHAVIDSGLARRPVFDAKTGLSRLETRWISKASALQRAGRAGRLGPGRCYRAWTAARQARLEDWRRAEILEADLAPLVLELANWGITRAQQLAWLDPPPAAHWQQAVELLQQLAALDDSAMITPVGREMARFPAHPRLSHLLSRAHGAAGLALAADVAALLSERDPLRRGPGGVDIRLRIDALARWRNGGDGRMADVDAAAMGAVDRVARQLRGTSSPAGDAQRQVLADPGVCVALAYPDRLAMCSADDGDRFLMRNGRAARLRAGDPLHGSEFLAIASVDAGRRDGVIQLAAALDRQDLQRLFADQIVSRREVRWDVQRADVVAREARRLGALLLSERAVSLGADDPVAECLLEQIRLRGLAGFFADPLELRARVMQMRRLEPDRGWPDFSEPALLDTLGEWLLPWLRPGEGVRQLRAIRLDQVLQTALGWEALQRLEQALPTHFVTPAGTRRMIRYAGDAGPLLALPLQEVLGLATGPQLADGRLTPLLHLLSPAGRVLQVTADLAGFWCGAYDAVKKEMRGRYPKHYWPDDPANATATRFTRQRMR